VPRSRETPPALYRRGDWKGAERGCLAVLRRNPRHPAALHLLGCLRSRRGRHDEAICLIRRAVAIDPSVPEYHENLAQAYHRAGQGERAEIECRVALRLEPTLHRPHNLLGLIALDRQDLALARRCFSDALDARRPYLDATINLAVALNRGGDHELARRCSETALKINPRHPGAWINLGLSLKALGRIEEAKRAFVAAGDHPMARFNLGYVHLLENDLARGLPLCEGRKKPLGIGKGLARPEWDGASHPDGTLLVVHEQGLGDTILMSRFYAILRERCARVVALVQPPLARLIAAAHPEVEVTTTLEGVSYDRWCATMSLPLLLGIDTAARIPNTPWIRLPAEDGVDAAPRSGKPRIGINWAGNPRFAFDAVRSTHLAELALLLSVGDVEWCSLHKGHLEHEAEAHGLVQPLREARDFLDTARVIAGLDLVISTETAIPNLSAAMGVRTCVLAGADVDWRWGAWYPGVTICRQQSPGNWFGPLAAALEVIREELIPAG
jgi:Flp pilus assembly protein TadD